MMDLTQTIEADSTQVNADDLTGSPRTVTITGVSKGTADQPVNFDLAEFPGRAYRPCKSMRRVLVAAWGPDASAYIGRRMTIFNDPTVRWGGQATGGIRISHLSHIDKKLTLALTVTRGKRSPFVVDPLPDAPVQQTAPTGNGITAKMVQDAGFENDENGRQDWLAFASNVAGRTIQATKELTVDEAALVIAELQKS